MLRYNYVIDNTKIRRAESKEQWSAILELIEENISKASYETRFKSTSAEVKEEHTIIVLCPNIFAANWLEKHYSELIFEAVKEVTGHPLNVEIQSASENKQPLDRQTLTFKTGLKKDNLKKYRS